MPESKEVFFERDQALAPDKREEVENRIRGRVRVPGCKHMLGSINGACIICSEKISVKKRYDHSIRKFVNDDNIFLVGKPVSFNIVEVRQDG